MQRLTAHFDHPERSFKAIHVGGTNGKGSVSTKIAAALQFSGYCTGLFTSPHISSYCERMTINGELISEEDVASLLTEIFTVLDKENMTATFFEITTLLGFIYFAKQKVDFAVFEVGIGGRLDATNVLEPEISVITSISLDHTELLGHTLEAIAREKGGIIKPKTPVILGLHAPFSVLETIAEEKSSPIQQVTDSFRTFDQENSAVARLALNELAKTIPLSNAAIESGLKKRPACRYEWIDDNPPTLIDVAHNPEGLKSLFAWLRLEKPDQPFRILFGLSKSKDIEGCLDVIIKNGSAFHLVQAPNERSASLSLLENCLKSRGVQALAEPDFLEGLVRAKKMAKEREEVLVICGSFFIIDRVLQFHLQR